MGRKSSRALSFSKKGAHRLSTAADGRPSQLGSHVQVRGSPRSSASERGEAGVVPLDAVSLSLSTGSSNSTELRRQRRRSAAKLVRWGGGGTGGVKSLKKKGRGPRLGRVKSV